jgi:RHS repeat-associated protein
MTYTGLTTTVNDGFKTKTSTKNALSKVISLTDSPGGTITYIYFANGNLKKSTFDTAVTNITQDAWGRKKQLTDPSAGSYQYEYNDFGETTKETVLNITSGTIKGITTYNINSVGKLNFKTIVGQNGDLTNSKVTYTYDPTTKLMSAKRYDDFTAANNILYNYYYDAYKRLINKTESSALTFFSETSRYDAFGRVYIEGFDALNNADNKRVNTLIRYTYQNGYQFQIIDDTTGDILRQLNSVNARGQLLSANSGVYTKEKHTFDQYGLPLSVTFQNGSGPYANSNLYSIETDFDALTGNLKLRNNSFLGFAESFTYDNLDRLLTYPNQLGVTQTQNYDDKGKITTNNIGAYAYTIKNKPYQVSSITPADQTAASTVLNYYASREQNITYNVFKSPVSITENGVENIDFQYNASNTRATMYYGGTQTDKLLRTYRKMYSEDGTMEIKRNIATNMVEFTFYIGGDGYTAPIILRSDGKTQSYMYLHRDYQGSIIAITDSDGQVLEKRFFDAWGAITKYENSNGATKVPTTSSEMILDRGYTGHEHLIAVGLINMNARLYDPKLHRFLQPDNYVQDPSNTQNYNRYGYCINNPLKYTDKNGEFFFSFVSAVFETLYNVAVHGVNVQNYDYKITNNAWKIDMGLFQGNIGQTISRLTWELPQTLLGYAFSGFSNWAGDVEKVAYYDGATVVTHKSSWGGVTLGSYINGGNTLEANPNNTLFQHEYGHYLQSQKSGLFYLGKYGIPSILSKGDHDLHPAEQDANSRAFTYFNNHVENYQGWNSNKNQIKGYNFNKPFNDASNQLALSNALNNLKWYDFILFPTTGIFGQGIVNTFIQNKNQ